MCPGHSKGRRCVDQRALRFHQRWQPIFGTVETAAQVDSNDFGEIFIVNFVRPTTSTAYSCIRVYQVDLAEGFQRCRDQILHLRTLADVTANEHCAAGHSCSSCLLLHL